MYEHGMLAPVVALVAWSLVMLVWLYATRIPAMAALKINPEKFKDDPAAREKLPVGARRVAANYAHLAEQPTLFYAIAFAIQLQGDVSEFNIGLAWLYVALRVAHSLVQATVNIIAIRFTIFLVATVVLAWLTANAARALNVMDWFS